MSGTTGGGRMCSFEASLGEELSWFGALRSPKASEPDVLANANSLWIYIPSEKVMGDTLMQVWRVLKPEGFGKNGKLQVSHPTTWTCRP